MVHLHDEKEGDVETLRQMICPQPSHPKSWQTLITHQDDTWFMLRRGMFRNSESFYLVWGKNKGHVGAFLFYSEDTRFVVHYDLATVIEQAQNEGVDILTIPFSEWIVEN